MAKYSILSDVLQLPLPLNTLHTMHFNAKSHNLLYEPCLIINFVKLPVDGYPKNRKSIRYAEQ